MDSYQVPIVLLLLTAAVMHGHSSNLPTSNPDHSHEFHVPREPRVEQPHHEVPPHAAAVDKAVQPALPRDTNVGSIPCTNDTFCKSTVLGEDAICLGHSCACPLSTRPSDITHKCLKESSLGGGCEEDWQCTNPLGSTVTCKNNQCGCVQDAVLIKGKCIVQKHLSEQCELPEECLKGQDTECVDHRCTCKSGYTSNPSNDKCLKTAVNYEDPCEEDIQCTESMGDGSECEDAKCVCQDSYHHRNHKCMKNLILGQACGSTVDGDCFLPHGQGINHVDCIDGKCQCTDDHTPSSDNQKCLADGQKDDGSGGGAGSIQPFLLTSLTILLAIFLLS